MIIGYNELGNKTVDGEEVNEDKALQDFIDTMMDIIIPDELKEKAEDDSK